MTPEEEEQRRRFFELAQSMPPPQPSLKVIEEERLRKCVLKELVGGLWHTTHPDRFQAILKTGAILPEPNIPDSERWISYVRTIRGVSLFDFDQFEPEGFSQKYPWSDWGAFVPFHDRPGHGRANQCAVWIEIDRDRVADRLISPAALMERWHADGTYQTVMPHLEAAHIGPIPCSAFKRAFLVSEGDREIRPIPLTPPAAAPNSRTDSI